jgi:hypothetical protein
MGYRGEMGNWATDFVTDLTDGLSRRNWQLGNGFCNGFNGWVIEEKWSIINY